MLRSPDGGAMVNGLYPHHRPTSFSFIVQSTQSFNASEIEVIVLVPSASKFSRQLHVFEIEVVVWVPSASKFSQQLHVFEFEVVVLVPSACKFSVQLHVFVSRAHATTRAYSLVSKPLTF